MSARTPTPSVREGTLIKGYRVGRLIGSGSMGEVYEAKNEANGRRVALKLLRENTEEAANAGRRLLEEARAVNAIRHPGIVEVFDLGLMGDRPFLVMELLEGVPLSARIKQGLMPVAEAVGVLEGILDALGAAHRAGVIHRDLKPSNVFLEERPRDGRRVKLLDFGVARREGRTELLTGPSMAVGSMGFMGPEQLMGKAVVASDLYAVGCMAFLMLSGKSVFPLKNIPDNARAHLSEPPPKLRALRPEVPAALEAWVGKLLEKRPESRPSSADHARSALRELQRGTTAQTEASNRTELVAAFVPPSSSVEPALRATETETTAVERSDETLVED